MGYGLTNHLLAICIGVFGASLLIAWRRLPASWAVLLAAIRVFVPLIYFAWYFDGQWTILDDLVYFDHGQNLLEQGFTPLSILTAEGRTTVYSMVGGDHVFYAWWNLVVMWFFGTHYYVPVLINVAVTFLSAHLLAGLASETGLSKSYQRLLQVCFLLHWDTIAWSSFVNIKDMIVQLMTIAFFLCAIRSARRKSWSYAVLGGVLVLGFFSIRFYIPFIVGAAAAAWVFLEWKDFRKYPLLAGGLLVGIWAIPGRGYQILESFSPFEALYGIARFVLTPQPWAIHEHYTYLMLPSTCHWLMILPAAAGGVMLWRDSRVVRLILLYASIMIVLYSLADEIQGVRQRSQLSFVFAWAQVHFLWRWMRTSVRYSVPLGGATGNSRAIGARAA